MSTGIPDPDSVKMFVGQIPRTMDDDELKLIMEEFGPVYQLGVIRDRASSQHRGKCQFMCCVYIHCGPKKRHHWFLQT